MNPLAMMISAKDFGINCLIHNNQYENEYLYSLDERKAWTKEPKKFVNLIKLERVKNFSNLRWSLIETTNGSQQYFMKSLNHDDNLCATSIHADNFHLRRTVIRLKLNTGWDICKWKIQKLNSNTSNRTYTITNVFYNEPLYAASFFFQTKAGKREIFLWHKKDFNSKKFKWIIEC